MPNWKLLSITNPSLSNRSELVEEFENAESLLYLFDDQTGAQIVIFGGDTEGNREIMKTCGRALNA